jgi:Domain of unknown function (DUF4157)
VGKSTRAEAAGRGAGRAGKGLPQSLRSQFEKSLGKDLGDVRIHDDADAADMADSVDARAYAQGQDIQFNAGEYAPDTAGGRRLIAHEVAHTVQQSGATPTTDAATTTPGDSAEKNADQAAAAMLEGRPADVSAQPQSIARKTKGEADEPEKEKKPLPTNPRDLVSVSEGKLTKSGSVTTTVNKTGVEINAPLVTMMGTAQLTPAAVDADEDVGTVEVGPIQNVTSKRIGIYRKPGSNEVVARYNSIVNSLLDQRPDGNNNDKPWAKKPWYQPPATLSKTQMMNSVVFKDQPGFELPIKNGGGILTEVQGADNFTTSVGMKHNGGEVTHLSSQQWSVPWDMQIDAATHMGDIGKKNETKFTDNNKIVPTVLDGPLATNAVDYYSFPTVEAARAAGVDALLSFRGLAGARGRDQESYMNMWHAIRGLNPAWTISVKCVDHEELFSDPVSVTMKGHGGMNKTDRFKMSKGEVKTTYVRFLELFDPDKWTSGDALKFAIQASKFNFKEVSVLAPPSNAFMPVTTSDGTKNTRYEYAVTRSDNG